MLYEVMNSGPMNIYEIYMIEVERFMCCDDCYNATAQMLYSDIRSLIVWLRTFQNIAAPLLARKNPASVGLDPSPLQLI
jgi:hypothetical protein